MRGFTPDSESLIVPETVTGTILPFGGHRLAGDAEMVMRGGVVSPAGGAARTLNPIEEQESSR